MGQSPINCIFADERLTGPGRGADNNRAALIQRSNCFKLEIIQREKKDGCRV